MAPSGRIRIGMSGFSYPAWVGGLYPEGTRRGDMLSVYATRLGAVEVNLTFRRLPEEETVTRWAAQTPEGFRFAPKAPQRITHFKKLAGTGEDVAAFTGRMKLLGPRLGPLLFQVPPSLELDVARMKAFAESLPAGFAYAFEGRHPSFRSREADELLTSHGMARCLNDDLEDPRTYRGADTLAYLRFRRDAYDSADLKQRASLLRELAEAGRDVYAFFKHEDRPDAAEPALALQELLGS